MNHAFKRLALGVASLVFSLSFIAAEDAPVIAALKGPSGIALVQLFENPPHLTGNRVAKMEAVSSADLMVAKVVSGEYQVAVLPINMAAKLRRSGVDIELAAIIGNGMLSFLTNDPSIKSLAELRGRRIDVAGQGATPDFLFRRILKDGGLDPDKDLNLSFALGYAEMASALAAGSIESAVLPEPFSTLARMKNPKLLSPLDLTALWKKSTGMSDYPMTALVIRKGSSITEADARIILDAVRASISKTLQDPVAAGALVEKHGLGLTSAIAAAAIPRCNFVYLEAARARPEVEALLAEFLAAAPASIGGALPDDAFYASF
ncbi:MAG TPA: ABC transporter substrate-binding protein [Rectinemataceae bacterium]|nr:ABC transporter substrate-binding protein [Rectinemataceae bacterium]